MTHDEEPLLTAREREVVGKAKWFSSLPSILRHEILRRVTIRNFDDGELLFAQGDPADSWMCCASGAVKISSASINGREFTLTYVGPGVWFGDVDMFDGRTRVHNGHAHGQTRALFVAETHFRAIASQHHELYEAMMKLHSRHIRQLYSMLADTQTLGLRARIAKHVLNLARRHGVDAAPNTGERRLTLRLAQGELCQLVGCSRQRINQELKLMEREGAIGVNTLSLVLRNTELLARFAAEA